MDDMVKHAFTRSTPYFLLSGVALLISYIVLVVAMCAPRQRNLYFFTSGVLFIISGLIMLIGLIMYISIFKAEIGSKMRPKSPLQLPLFTFTYGQSFCLYVIGFVLTEIVGVLNVFLFIGLQQIQFEDNRVLPCLSYFDKKKEIDTAGHAVHFQKHPMLPNGYYSPMSQRRYFFEKNDNIDVHHTNQVPLVFDNRYRDFSTSTLPSFDANKCGQQFPLTRSVSTATELFEVQGRKNHMEDDQNRSNHKLYGTLRTQSNYHLNHNVARTSAPLDRSGSTASIPSNKYHNASGTHATQLSKSKDELFNEFCERAGRRYHPPKEIYFIDLDQENDHAQAYEAKTSDYEHMMCKTRRMSMHHIGSTTATRNSNLYASNSSLHKSYPKNLFELEHRSNLNRDGRSKKTSGDSRNWRQSNEYSSQTLPRDFLKRNVDFERSIRAEDDQEINHSYDIHNNRSYDQPTNFEDAQTYRDKSYDSLASNQQRQTRQLQSSQDDIVKWPNAIPASPSGFSSRSPFHIRPGSLYLGQHGQATPSRQFYGHGLYEQKKQREPPTGQPQQSIRQSPDGDFGTFDLDRMENERRKSHASLFESTIDYENGTAV